MMTERQRKFREQYKSEISPLYNGLLHIAVMYGVGITGVWYCLTKIQDASWEWLMALPVFLAGNFVEWFMHRYVMHKRIDVFALRAIYERHTRQHHQYFTDLESTIDTTREFREAIDLAGSKEAHPLQGAWDIVASRSSCLTP